MSNVNYSNKFPVNWFKHNMETEKDSEIIDKLNTLESKIEDLINKFNLIFGSNVIIEGKFIDWRKINGS